MSGRRTPRDFSTEAGFQKEIVRLAKRAGWTVNHTYRARLRDGTWRTTTTLKGMLDLMFVRPGELGFLEVKKAGEDATPEQLVVCSLLQTVPGVWAYIVQPSDWADIVELLT